MKQKYLCKKCGTERPPYQFYCERHQAATDTDDEPSVLDRFMNRMLGRGKSSAR